MLSEVGQKERDRYRIVFLTEGITNGQRKQLENWSIELSLSEG